jgi:hypothetical protein
MPTGHYLRRPHSKETKKRMSESHKGKNLKQSTKDKMSKAKTKEKHPRWKGEDAAKITKHIYVAKNKSKPKGCEYCSKERKLSLANMKNHRYTKNPQDYKWLCYSCHKIMDMGWINKKEFSLFIKELKEINERGMMSISNNTIDELAGDKLIENSEDKE